MAVIVIGGQTRNVGKTSVMCGIISAMPEKRWTAIKITSHIHISHLAQTDSLSQTHAETPAINIYQEHDPTTGADTSRYLAAGATRSFLIQAAEAHLAQAIPHIKHEIASSDHVLIESNSILHHIQPDLYAVVLDPENPDCKPSLRRHLNSADAILSPRPLVDDPQNKLRFRELAGPPIFEIAPPGYLSAAFNAFVAEKLHNSGK